MKIEERRRNSRWQINQERKINVLEDNPFLLDGIIDDITFRGARVSLRHRLPEKTVLSLTINSPMGLVLGGLEATVVWRRESEEINIYGLSFNRINDRNKQKIYDFVYDNFPQEITRHWWI